VCTRLSEFPIENPTPNNNQCGSLEHVTPNQIVRVSDFDNSMYSFNNASITHDYSSLHPAPIHQSSQSTNVCTTEQEPAPASFNVTNEAPTDPVEAKSPEAVLDTVPTLTAVPYHDDMSIQLNADNMVLAHLPNHEKVITLIDSGASDSLVCSTFIAQSRYLSKLPKITITPRKFKVGNGQHIIARYAIEIPITIQRHKFIVRALAMDTLGGVNLVLGTPALSDIDASLEFRCHKLHFRHSTFVARLTKSVTLKPKHVLMVSVTAKLPNAIKDACHFVTTSKFMSQFTSSHMLLQFRNGYASLLVTNHSDKEVTLRHDKIFGIIDLRYMTQV
jgi:hypothetical protein